MDLCLVHNLSPAQLHMIRTPFAVEEDYNPIAAPVAVVLHNIQVDNTPPAVVDVDERASTRVDAIHNINPFVEWYLSDLSSQQVSTNWPH